ncbi:MAG: DNA gyrase/topoisomerase IV subunit A [Saprospiraceae bacterium]|nr:DNA gyrase/topoisomerase IV subunit A [Saprospiraceae bacterium]
MDANGDHVTTLGNMYQNYFLDYASYVILERAVPHIHDGLKPVQRRILHAMKEMDDGRYHKVANIIGQTMQYHPHGDAAIGDALVNLGQKDLVIDCQGNWGDIRTGDGAAAPRYIEARLTPFAREVVFNAQTTEWQLSYDGRKREPITLPVKFPLLLAQGVDGIAVGLSTKILPHNFIELIKASIDILRGRPTNILPDFQTGGMMDATNYNGGKRGGKVRVRARLEISKDKKALLIKEIPYGTTTGDLVESILKAAEKGKIKIKKVVDQTAKDVEVVIELQPGVSPDVTMDALYAFSDCEVSISPNACVIYDNKPLFLDVNEMLRLDTELTKYLLKRELEIKQDELEEKWHFASLEKIFIENRIYHQIEEAESWEQVLKIIPQELKKYVREPNEAASANDNRLVLLRGVSEEDVTRLTEIRIKRISKYNSFAADEMLKNLLNELAQVKHDLEHLIEFTIKYYDNLLKKYGKGRERKTEIRVFDTIQATEVVANNAKLFVNRKDGFIGTGLKKGDGVDFVSDCSDIDDIIVFRKDGKFQVVRVADKVFVGKDIIHVAVWRKGDERTTYNLIYLDGKSGISYAKRFNVTAITRATEYDLTQGNNNSKLWYFTANPNGESEIVSVQLTQSSTAKIKRFDFDFATLSIKGRNSQGNIVTKYPVREVKQKTIGKSTLGAKRIWFDDITGKLNDTERGRLIGEFDTGDNILILYKDGTLETCELDLIKHFELNDIVYLGKVETDTVVTTVYFDGNKGWTMVKRFKVEGIKNNERLSYLTENKKSQMLFVSVEPNPRINYAIKIGSKKMDGGEVLLAEFIDVKGWKALGNKLSDQKLLDVKEVIVKEESKKQEKPQGINEGNAENQVKELPKFQAGDTIEFDFGD